MIKIFCDMDGVLADFVGGVCAAHGKESPYGDSSSYGVFDMEKLWGMTVKEFWTPTRGMRFWASLEKTHEADWLVDYCAKWVGVSNIAILTDPSNDPGCILGKKAWIKKYYPQLVSNMIFTSAKDFLAAPNHLLIDDRDRNIEEFRAAGGMTIRVPRFWNSDWDSADMTWKIVEHKLGMIQSGKPHVESNGK